MNFLFPFFLFAGLAIAIPILIHLFNFRKFKTIYFSDTRLLQEIKITSKKRRTVQNWLLLASRILFVLALVLAFAQPFFGKKSDAKKAVKLIYVDNSVSMEDKGNGQKSLLLNAKEGANAVVNSGSEDQQYIILNNNAIYASRPLQKSEALEAISKITLSAKSVSLSKINESVNDALTDNNAENATVYFFSDLQKSTLLQEKIGETKKNVQYNFFPISHKGTENIFIDTAYFTQPILDSKQENPLVVKLARTGADSEKDLRLEIWVNGQVRATKKVVFQNDSVSIDTLPLVVNTPGWHQIEVIINDAPIQFDDTFRISAKTNSVLSILNLSDGGQSPYLQAAFSPSNGFQVTQSGLNSSSEDAWTSYNLIVLQQIKSLPSTLALSIKNGLDKGMSFFLVPGQIGNLAEFNSSLAQIGTINFSTLDTSRQQIGSLQTQHPLLKDVIASLPQNVQLPLVQKHYPISASLSASPQAIMSLKNGQPFLVQYTIGKGNLYIVASPLEESAGNFVLSNLFMPILYKMSSINGSPSIYALNANSKLPIFLPNNAKGNSVYKAIGRNIEVVPPQTAEGKGINIYLGKVASEPGFYTLKKQGTEDSVIVALNNDGQESRLTPATEDTLKKILAPAEVEWETSMANISSKESGTTDLWRWAIVLAVIALLLETYLLATKRSKKPKIQN